MRRFLLRQISRCKRQIGPEDRPVRPLRLQTSFIFCFVLSCFFYKFFFFNFSNLFIFICDRLNLCCWTQASPCGGFSCYRVQALGTQASVFVAHRLWSTDSVVVAHGFSCPLACGIFLDQELNLCPLR